MSRDRSTPWQRASAWPRGASDNAYDDVHEHPTEWPEEVWQEPRTPHPGDEPVETSTEPRGESPERSHRVARPRASPHREAPPGITRVTR